MISKHRLFMLTVSRDNSSANKFHTFWNKQNRICNTKTHSFCSFCGTFMYACDSSSQTKTTTIQLQKAEKQIKIKHG